MAATKGGEQVIGVGDGIAGGEIFGDGAEDFFERFVIFGVACLPWLTASSGVAKVDWLPAELAGGRSMRSWATRCSGLAGSRVRFLIAESLGPLGAAWRRGRTRGAARRVNTCGENQAKSWDSSFNMSGFARGRDLFSVVTVIASWTHGAGAAGGIAGTKRGRGPAAGRRGAALGAGGGGGAGRDAAGRSPDALRATGAGGAGGFRRAGAGVTGRG